MTERAKAWRSKVRARSITTYCATNMNQENSMCLVDRDLFVTPGTNDQALFIIKYVCIYENLMLKPPEVYVDPNKLQARPPSSQILANLKAKSKSRTAAQKAALLAKIEERRKLAREKAAKKTEMENACSAIKNATECIEGCFWNPNMPEGEQCSLCRGLTRKNPSYDEGDACLPDYFTLVCDDRGKDARIFVREVIQDISANAVSDAEKQWRSKTRARKITTFCALGNNFAHNQCSFRRAQLAGNEVTPGAIFTIKYVCFYSNRLPAVPRIWFDPLTSTQAILDLARRLQIETEEEAQEEEKKQLTAKKIEEEEEKKLKKKKKKGFFALWDNFKNLFKKKKKSPKKVDEPAETTMDPWNVTDASNDTDAEPDQDIPYKPETASWIEAVKENVLNITNTTTKPIVTTSTTTTTTTDWPTNVPTSAPSTLTTEETTEAQTTEETTEAQTTEETTEAQTTEETTEAETTEETTEAETTEETTEAQTTEETTEAQTTESETTETPTTEETTEAQTTESETTEAQTTETQTTGAEATTPEGSTQEVSTTEEVKTTETS